MIKETELLIPITNRNKTYYINKGYTIEKNQLELLVKTTDINPNSHFKITAICNKCKKETKLLYYKYIQNYNRHDYYSCKSCSRDKAALTNIKLYGKKTYMESDEGKERYKELCLAKYDAPDMFSVPEIQLKARNTINAKYGTNCALQDLDIAEKTKLTLLKKYGIDNYSKTEKFKHDMKSIWIPFYDKQLKNVFNIHNYKILDNFNLFIKCSEGCDHYYEISYKLLTQRVDRYKVRTCTVCNPVKKMYSDVEYQLLKILEDITTVVSTDKDILHGKHIDILLPENNMGIEYNGVFWHSEKYKEKNDHLNKSLDCLEKNIKLFHIFEDQWKHNKDEVIKLLTNKIQNKYKIINDYKIKKITKSKIQHNLIFNNTISNSNIYELKNDIDTIGTISFNKNTITYLNWNFDYDINKIFEIFINELKLQNFFYKHDINNIFLNTDKFINIKIIKPDYKYFDRNDKLNIKLLNKNKINIKYKNNKSIILENGYLRVYDCGYKLFKIV